MVNNGQSWLLYTNYIYLIYIYVFTMYMRIYIYTLTYVKFIPLSLWFMSVCY